MARILSGFLQKTLYKQFLPLSCAFSHLRPLVGVSAEFQTSSPQVSLPVLRPTFIPLVTQVCGFKVRYKLKKRCKDCYFVVRNERTYVLCPTHPRHKQMSMVKKPKYTWVLTHACQSKVRPW